MLLCRCPLHGKGHEGENLIWRKLFHHPRSAWACWELQLEKKKKPNICNMNSVVSSGAWHSWGCHISGLRFYRNKRTMCVNHAAPEIRSKFWLENKVNHGFITWWPLQAGLQSGGVALVQRPDSEGACRRLTAWIPRGGGYQLQADAYKGKGGGVGNVTGSEVYKLCLQSKTLVTQI